MQLSRFAFFILPAVAIAGVLPASTSDKCYSGSLLCCKKMADPNDTDWDADFSAAADKPTDNLTGKIGLECTTIRLVVGGLENPCAAAEVCCNSYNPNTLIGFGCVEDFNA